MIPDSLETLSTKLLEALAKLVVRDQNVEADLLEHIHRAGLALLAAHLTPEIHVELLDRARHKSKREIEELLADRAPKPEVKALVRKLPETTLPRVSRRRSRGRWSRETRGSVPS